MNSIRMQVLLAGLMMVSTACSKMMMTSTMSNSGAGAQSVACKGEAAPVDPAALKIEGSTVAQAGRTASFSLNYDLSCSNTQKVSWDTNGQIIEQNGHGMVSSFPSPGHFFVAAEVQSTGGTLASKGTTVTSLVQKTTVVGSSPIISGTQAGMVGRPYTYTLSLPEGFNAAGATWDFGDKSSGATGLDPVTHAWSTPGIYSVVAKVSDGTGTTTNAVFQVNIIDTFDGIDCVSDTSVNAPTQATVGQPVNVSVFLPSCIANSVTSVSWSFGDNTPVVQGASAQHTFNAVGDYTVTVNVYAPYVPAGHPFLTLVQTIHVTEAPPAPTPSPTPNPVATPVATPTPGAALCVAGATRESTSTATTRQVACGIDGTKTQTYQNRIIEACQLVSGDLTWKQVSSTEVLVSESACQGQSCTLPDGSKLANNQSRVLYTSSTPAGSCSSVSQARTCVNGVLGGSSSYAQLACRSGCGDFGVDGTKKTGVVIGQTQVALTCQYGEQGIFDTFSQIADQTCTDGSVVTSNTRQGTKTQAGVCPTYGWAATDNWTACSANCGGKQSLIYICQDNSGHAAPNERCPGSAPVQERLCDGNPAAVVRKEVSTSTQSAGSTKVCPANQIGVMVSERTVTETKTYSCVDHSVQVSSDVTTNGAWATESYCRDYVAHRCSQDSLSIEEAAGRYDWMVACRDKAPVINEFLTKFENVKVSGNFTIGDKGRPLYPTFMDSSQNPEAPWIAPTDRDASCEVPAGAYVASVCLSSCATPDQEIMAQAQANLKLKYLPFVDALTQKASAVATLQTSSSMSSRNVVATPVDQWVTEMLDTQHDIIEFHMESGRVLKLTPNHPLLTKDGVMKPAGDFQVGESLVMLGGQLDPIVSANHVMYFGKVYNLFVKSADLQRNVVVTNGYLNGTAFFQNEGASNLNRAIFRDHLTRGVLGK